jgi:uncharacterized protein (DUF2252 family)
VVCSAPVSTVASVPTGSPTSADGADSAAAGKAARREAPRSAHADWEPAADRADPVDVVEQESATRVPELVPIRYGRMLVSPFTFFRGAAGIMAADLAGSPVSGFSAQLCGDAHLSNFGVFGSPDRRLVFDINDFDETHEGPWEWDVKRLAASLEVAGRDRGFTRTQRTTAVVAAVRRYREAMRSFATMSNLDVWYARMDVEAVVAELARRVPKRDVDAARRMAAKARSKDSVRALSRLTEVVDGRLRFVSAPPLIERISDLLPHADARDLEARISALLDAYAESLPHDRGRFIASYRFVDMARKVVGVGSVGTRAWVLLFEGRDRDDPLVLQAKEAEASVLEQHVGPGPYENQGERVVQGQRLMQATGDILLGWVHTTGIDDRPRDFYVRQLWDWKGSAEVETMPPDRLARYGELCGWALARAHARSGDRVAIAAYLGSGSTFDRALAEFADRYADQNDADFRALQAAVDDGRLTVRPG